MFVEPNGTKARFVYKINRSGEVMFVLIMWLLWAGLYQSTTGLRLVLLWRTRCSLSPALLSVVLSAAADGNEPPVCMPGLPKAPGELKLAGCGEHPGWRPLVSRDDWQCQHTLERTQRGFERQGKTKLKNNNNHSLWRAVLTCCCLPLALW